MCCILRGDKKCDRKNNRRARGAEGQQAQRECRFFFGTAGLAALGMERGFIAMDGTVTRIAVGLHYRVACSVLHFQPF